MTLNRKDKMSKNALFPTLTVIVVLLFSLLLIIRLYLDTLSHSSIRLTNLLLPLTFISIFMFKSKISWILGVLTFTFGLYYYMVARFYAAYPGIFEFTLPLTELLFGNGHGFKTGHPFEHFISVFPFMFYMLAIILFMTKRVRELYWNSVSKYNLNGI